MSTLPTKSYPLDEWVMSFMMTNWIHRAEISAEVEWAVPGGQRSANSIRMARKARLEWVDATYMDYPSA